MQPSPRTILFFIFCLFRAAPVAYGGSQTRGPVGAIAAGLCQSHSKEGSELHLWTTPQLPATPILNPLSKARDRNCILMVLVGLTTEPRWELPAINFRTFSSTPKEMCIPDFFFLHAWYVEVPRPGMEPVPQLRQCWIPNPLCHKGTSEIVSCSHHPKVSLFSPALHHH